MKEETIVRLMVISLHHPPEAISDLLKLTAQEQWHIGEMRTCIKEHGWVLDSGLPRSSSLEEHCEALLVRIGDRAAKLREISRTATVQFSCVIYSQREPALNFDPRVVSRIAELGASLDIDLYVLKNLGSTEEEQETV